jgi:threonine/homoserine/homoserine lactone efflux protein
MTIEVIWKGFTLGLLLTIAVGPVLFTIIKQSLNSGVKGGLAFVLGVSLSDISLVIASNFFTELFTALDNRRTEIGIIGSVFLVSVGVYYLFFKKLKVDEQGLQQMITRKRDYAKLTAGGFLMNLLNPAIIIFWLTTSTAFADQELDQRFVIFAIALCMLLAGDIGKVVLAGKLRKRLTLKNISLLNKINGVVLIGFGLALIAGLIWYPHNP